MVRLPNILTILRILLVPFFVVTFALPGNTARLVAFAIFCIAGASDALDGLAARKLQAPGGMILLLTHSELALLTALLNKAQQVVPRDELSVLLNGDEPDGSGRAVDLHISRLRRKIQGQADTEIIRTYRGVGYMLDAKVAE